MNWGSEDLRYFLSRASNLMDGGGLLMLREKGTMWGGQTRRGGGGSYHSGMGGGKSHWLAINSLAVVYPLRPILCRISHTKDRVFCACLLTPIRHNPPIGKKLRIRH